MKKSKNNTIHIMPGEKTENNKTDQEVSEEYRKQIQKKNDENDLLGNQSDLLCRCSHTYIKLIQSRSGRIEECQEGIL